MKLCRGGGHEVAHSRDAPYPQGSSTVTFSVLRVIQILIKNGIIESASRNEPTVEIIFIVVKPSVAR
ncbi:unannotated protein [freshwater metagenome]|uniref:Unannotated protein n=1 Tax=freshwater metagenome TaxID=449393 RepID=A0A6J7UDG3_9ZZZZ